MRIAVYYPGCCQNCGRSVPLDEADYGREDIPGGYRIFCVCPHCGCELMDEVGPVDDHGHPISQQS